MDELDRTILQFLQQDGRKPFTEIAQKLDISEGTVRNRVSRLIEDDILRIVGVADPVKLGFTVSSVVGVSVQGGDIDKIGKKIATFPEVNDVIMVSGEFDLILIVYCRDREHLTTFLKQSLRPILGISRTQTFIVLSSFKSNTDMHPLTDF
ncbi:MAG: Lrp/AsnC family transcriptional regulator [Anaerolineales bacterium]|nr:Lrp/AsnC family transcriptional regulator [Chloroflexota bacterium]MBL6982992.1 Lrp/AsnC family transcriptional regulator [Anaerolineales bacterium]